MRGFRFGPMLASTALAVVLGAAASPGARAQTGAVNEATVPLAEPAEVTFTPAELGLRSPAVSETPAAAAGEREGLAQGGQQASPEPASTATIASPETTKQPDSAPATRAAEQPAVVQEATPAKQPAVVQEATPAEQPAVVQEAAPAKQPAVVQEAAPAEHPAVVQETTPAKQPAVVQEATPAKQPAVVQESTPPDPAPTASVATVTIDQQVGQKLRELLAAKSERLFDRKTRAAVDAYYATRDFLPLWSDNGAPSARAKAAIAQLASADADGLDPADYPTPAMAAGSTPEALAEAELRLTASVLTYARHAQVGRVHFSRVAADIYYVQPAPEPADVLGKLAAASDVRAALDSYNPQHPAYKALKAKLAEARGQTAEATQARVAGGPVLKVGMKDPRVPQLRARLGIAGDASDTSYDKAVADAVKKFQRERAIAASGNLTAATLDALNGARRRERTADIIVANLERWRWLPHDLGKAHVVVNIPEYTLRVFNGDAIVWTTRIVVGKPSTPTPLLSETMKYITVNPTWNVPPSIVYNEYLPVLQQDPDALARIGLQVTRNRDGSIHIYQPPGERNALGRIRFNFPNKFLVYQHDTPDKYLFAHDRRAYSHGCMRVQNPDKYAEVLLSLTSPKERYSAERIRSMYGRGEQQINFPTPIPVHLTYQTAYVDEAGKLVLRDDIYGRDSRVLAALKSDERRYADVPVERREQSAAPRRHITRLPETRPSGGFSFFGLFRSDYR